MEKVGEAVYEIRKKTKSHDYILLLGTPARIEGKLYNVALVIYKGDIIGIVPKKNLSHQEQRWFSNGSDLYDKTFEAFGTTVTFDRNVFASKGHENASFAVTLSDTSIEYLNPENKTVYAHWRPYKYTIKFNKNNSNVPSSDEMESIEMTYGVAKNLPYNSYTVNASLKAN